MLRLVRGLGKAKELAQAGSQTVERALRLVDVLAAHHGGLRLTEVAQGAALNSRTAARLLGTLMRAGYVRQNARGRFVLGYHLLQLAQTVQEEIGLAEIAAPMLEGLVAATNENSFLSILGDRQTIVVARATAMLQLRVVPPVGAVSPLYCTAAGKVLLAHQPDAQIAEILADGMPARTAATITDPAAMMVELAHIRAVEYAVDRGEYEERVICVAVPIRDATETVVASCGIAGVEPHIRPEGIPALVQAVRDAGELLSSRLGYRTGSGRAGQLARLGL